MYLPQESLATAHAVLTNESTIVARLVGDLPFATVRLFEGQRRCPIAPCQERTCGAGLSGLCGHHCTVATREQYTRQTTRRSDRANGTNRVWRSSCHFRSRRRERDRRELIPNGDRAVM